MNRWGQLEHAALGADAIRLILARRAAALRRVAPAPNRDETGSAETVWRISFWSADWTPWPALVAIWARFPGLRFDVQPHYERG